MIDLIIPYYNNPDGLIHTLDSINKDIFYVTVIDDGSSLYLHYHSAIDQVFRHVNCGPGLSRQKGIEKTNNPYIMFLDTGDIFLSKEVQKEITRAIYIDPNVDVFSFPYYHENKLTTDTDNRMHGKVYKREFINQYGITFTPYCSYMDEDVGFNRACRLCGKMTFINLPVIEQIEEPNSLTEKDNGAALYRDQTRALSLVSIHTVEICEKNNINPTEEIYQIAVALYYWFIRTAAERSEFLQEAWSGAKIFYDKFHDKIDPAKLSISNAYIKRCLLYKNKISFPINILRFVNEINHNETLPERYLTIY